MTIRLVSSRKKDMDIIGSDILIERLKKARSLNKSPDSIGITQYKWRSFTIAKFGTSGRF